MTLSSHYVIVTIAPKHNKNKRVGLIGSWFNGFLLSQTKTKKICYYKGVNLSNL